MYKNQLQELAQRSCFNLPSYTCIREGPDHAPRFKAVVDFNGETFESPNYCSTLRQAEHTAAEAALTSLSSRGPSHALTARVLDETGVYKNLLQEIAQRVGSPLPRYTTFRSGLGHHPVFTGTVTLSGIVFRGEPAKNKKQAEKNAALAAWLALKELARTQNASSSSSSSESENRDEQEQITIARALQNYLLTKEKTSEDNNNPLFASNQNGSRFVSNKAQFPRRPVISPQRASMTSSSSASKILPFFNAEKPSRPPRDAVTNSSSSSSSRPRFSPAYNASAPVVRKCGPMPSSSSPYGGFLPPAVTVRTISPVFSAPPPPPVNIRRVVGGFPKERPSPLSSPSSFELAPSYYGGKDIIISVDRDDECDDGVDESTALRCLEQLEI